MKMITKKESAAYDIWWNRGGKGICETSKERSESVWVSGYRSAKCKEYKKNKLTNNKE